MNVDLVNAFVVVDGHLRPKVVVELDHPCEENTRLEFGADLRSEEPGEGELVTDEGTYYLTGEAFEEVNWALSLRDKLREIIAFYKEHKESSTTSGDVEDIERE
jgi:hypothetical protein